VTNSLEYKRDRKAFPTLHKNILVNLSKKPKKPKNQKTPKNQKKKKNQNKAKQTPNQTKPTNYQPTNQLPTKQPTSADQKNR
jgi:hypothetical protein